MLKNRGGEWMSLHCGKHSVLAFEPGKQSDLTTRSCSVGITAREMTDDADDVVTTATARPQSVSED